MVLMRKHEGLINSGAADHIDLTNATSKINLRLGDMHDLISRLHVAISADFKWLPSSEFPFLYPSISGSSLQQLSFWCPTTP